MQCNALNWENYVKGRQKALEYNDKSKTLAGNFNIFFVRMSGTSVLSELGKQFHMDTKG